LAILAAILLASLRRARRLLAGRGNQLRNCPHQLRQLGDIRRDPSRLIFDKQRGRQSLARRSSCLKKRAPEVKSGATKLDLERPLLVHL